MMGVFALDNQSIIMAASSAHTDGCTASLFNTLSILPSLSFLAKLRKSTVQISCREMHNKNAYA